MNDQHKAAISQFIELGHLDLVLAEVKQDLAKQIMDTAVSDKERREELYLQAVNIDTLLVLFQGYTNDTLQE
jgi:hypothetical protein